MSRRYSEKELTEAVKDSVSFSGVMRRLNAGKSGSNHQWIKNRIINLGIDYSHFTHAPEEKVVRKHNRSPDEILVVIPRDSNSRRPRRKNLLYAMLSKGVDYRCGMADCPNPEPLWRGEILPLEIDHIDGDWHNNLLNNLRFLCPNCHHQTETNRRGHAISASSMEEYEEAVSRLRERRNINRKVPCPRCDGLKQRESEMCFSCQKKNFKSANIPGYRKEKGKPPKDNCPQCGDKKDLRAKLCRPCNNAKLDRNTKTPYPPLEELVERVRASSFLAVSKELGVSDNAVRKYLRNRGVDVKALARASKQ